MKMGNNLQNERDVKMLMVILVRMANKDAETIQRPRW